MILTDSKLDAVNLCLAGIGREPVPELDTPDLDAAMAVAIVDQMNQQIQINQGKGWWFNQERGWKLQVNPNSGEIRVPNNAVSILEARPSNQGRGNRLTIRGSRVYDTDQHTFDLRHISDSTIEFTLVMLLPFDELPITAKQAIAWVSRRIFVGDVVGDPNQDRREAQQEARAMQALTSENSRSSRRNALSDNPVNQSRLQLIGGFNNRFL